LNRPVPPAERWVLEERRLYLCTPDRPDLERFVEACIEGGVDVVQLREKRLTGADLSARANLVQRVCTDYNVPFVLNDDPALAAAIGADGVHVGQDDMEVAEARALVGTDAIVGLSTHARAELERAIGSGSEDGELTGDPLTVDHLPVDPLPVDYISAGPVSPTPTKPGRSGTGIDYVREASRRAPWTVWVTGGVDPATVGPLLATGARHFVVVRWLTDASDPKANARALRRVIDETIEENGP
jgi:thiamine-phosphate pyrophosphorylase